MKKFLIVFAAIILGLSVVFSVNAADYGNKKIDNVINRFENKASKSAVNQSLRLSKIKEKADRLITNRINELNRLLNRVSNDKRLTNDEKTSLSSDIQTDINGLTALKAKIDADTDVDTAKADTKTIITNYYIYRIFVPKTRLLITISNLQTLSANITRLTPQIQNLINTLKSQGKDVSSLQSLLDDVNSQLQTINTTLSNDKASVMTINISTASPNSVFVQVRKDLAKVRSDFAKIRHDIGQMREDLSSSPTP